jgi:hypothetical protein
VRAGLDLATRANELRWIDEEGQVVRVGVRRVEDVGALSMLRIQLGWEAFLEDIFIRYMCGARTAAGFEPVLLEPRQKSLENARVELLGKQLFLSWSVANTLQRAEKYFGEGEPFISALRVIRTTITEMNVVRNRIAHSSDYAREQFREVVRTHLGFVPRGMSPGRFLLTEVPGSPGERFIDGFGLRLIAAGTLLVP